MQSLKGVVVIATIVATAFALGACNKDIGDSSLKLGASDVTIAIVR